MFLLSPWHFLRSRRIAAYLGGLLLLTGLAVGAETSQWNEIAGGRWAELPPVGVGRTGFTSLSPQQTGVTFTNTLDERAAAANRVLLDGSGVATGDFDGDGRPDIFFCSLGGRNTLFKNLGGWRFADVTETAGLKRDARFYRGAVFADVNGDNALDLLVSLVGGGVQCWLNDGHGKFSDATAAARTASPFGAMTLALADVDGNGSLDLYVANNRADDIRDRGQANLQLVNGQMTVPPSLTNRLIVVNGQVLEYGEPDLLYLNNGAGQFTAVSWTDGRFRDEDGKPLTRPPLDWALTAAFRDLNGDGFPDLYVCNDFWTADRVWFNDGQGRFTAAPRLALRNMCASSMGVDFADIDRDGFVDFFVVDMLSRDLRLRKRQKLAQPPMPSPIGAIEDRPQFMRNTLYHQRGDGTFAEIANFAGVAASEWSWSPVFLDVDLDGFEDLLITSGHAADVQDLDSSVQIRARQRSWKGFTNDVERQRAFTQELMEHMRLYPRLETPIVAFRNRGDLRFEEVTTQWGTDTLAVHHGLAMADFEGDGDLDFVVNNLGSAAGIYRNECRAPRVALRLRGLAPNTQGIGAKVTLRSGAVPMQSQEIVCGGRYLSGSEALLVFAAGRTTGAMTLEVDWRSGRQNVVTNVGANRIYEIQESDVSGQWSVVSGLRSRRNRGGDAVTNAEALFRDVSELIRHTHLEEPFDDFERQPLLPRRLSQLGPGVSWFDLDADGQEDLIAGAGRGGRLACFRNDGHGGFQAMTGPPFDVTMTRDQTTPLGWRASDGSARLLAGSANYEDGETNRGGVLAWDLKEKKLRELFPSQVASVGPLALADMDGDGDLDLFAGGRVIPGRYPEAASSRLFRGDGAEFAIDSSNSQTLEKIGLVSGAVWSDLNDDGFPELVLACEWGPLKIFRNERGHLTPWNPAVRLRPTDPETLNSKLSTLNQWTGLWNGVTTGDFDGDGRLDVIASNWGWNGEAKASAAQPLTLFYGDLAGRGGVDVIETEWDPRTRALTPTRRLDVLGRHLPALVDRFRTHRAYSEALLDDVVATFAARPQRLEVTTLASMVFLNRGDHFEATLLPREAQLAPAFGVTVADFDGDGHEDAFLGQNFFATAAETPRLDAGRGVLLRGDGKGNLSVASAKESGVAVYGEQRGVAAADFDADGRVDLAVTQNGAATKLFRNTGAQPGWRVRLVGPPGNPHGIGAVLRLKMGERLGPARELHAGSGYWSQDGAIQVLARRTNATHLWVRWPGGATSTVPLPPEGIEVTVRK